MKKIILILTFLLLIVVLFPGCKKQDHKWEPPPCDQSAYVIINDVKIINCIAGSVNSISDYSMSFSRYENGLLYNIGMTVSPPYHADDYYSLYNDSVVTTQYTESCCESMPDQTNKRYYIYLPDSLNCYLRLHLDTVNKVASGMLKATYMNQKEPFDLVHVQCDTFRCKYSQY